MADVKIRNLPDWLVEWHKNRASQDGISLEQRLRNLLEESYVTEKRRIRRRLEKLAAETRRKCGELPSSVTIIRAIREEMEDH